MLAPQKRSYDQPRQHIKRQRCYFSNKDPYSQSYGFSAVMYGCQSWTIKKAEHQRTDAFQLKCWRRCLRIPWTARRSNQSILKEIIPEYWLEGLMLKLKFQIFGHLTQGTNWLTGKDPDVGKIEGRRRRDHRGWDGWIASLTQWTWVWASSRSWWWTGRPGMLQSTGSQGAGHNWATELKVVKFLETEVEYWLPGTGREGL